MFTSQDFYNQFQLNYFDYKQNANEHLLNLDEEAIAKIVKGIYHYNIEDFRNSIMMEIRMTCLWTIDTLFELMFCLLPDHKQRLQDDNILNNLSKKKPYYRDLNKFVNGSKGRFDAFKWSVKYSKKNEDKEYHCSVLRHLFYKDLFELPEEKEIQISVKMIQTALKYLGSEITQNREQLNSFKHGLKLFPFLKEFNAVAPGNVDNAVHVDLKGSISYQTIDKKQRTRKIQTSTLNPERDLVITRLCTCMIYNIIILRKTVKERFKIDGKNLIFVFTEKLMEELDKNNPRINNLTIELKQPFE
ncbi:hypothetical protein [Ulvibacterium sp.]|uniref:hypothetical protein n=1 Tax=Ulvibacterium sp. TaxID=2665914 RepID=UPI0026358BEE|nr:hypothetical protein [Ulvibacterium sp.]